MPSARRFLRSLAAAALASLALPLASCADLAGELQADDVAIAALVRTPELKNPQTNETVPGLTSFQLVFGQIDKSKISAGLNGKQVPADGAFKGLAQATVKLDFHDATNGDVEINVPDKGDGKYQIDSQTAAKLTYDPGVQYTATIAFGGQTFRLLVTAPDKTDIAEFAGKDVITGHDATQPFTVTRANPKGPAENDIAFVNLSKVTGTAKADAWNNVPQDAFGFLKLALDDTDWRADSFTIPASAFQPQTGYLVTMSALARGSNDTSDGSSPLFVGSTFLAGVAAGGGLVTK